MLMADYPKIVVRDDGIYKNQNLKCYDDRHHVQVSEIIITKEAFIEAFNKWITDPKSSGSEDK